MTSSALSRMAAGMVTPSSRAAAAFTTTFVPANPTNGMLAGDSPRMTRQSGYLLPTEKGMRTVLEFTAHEARPLPADLFEPEAARALP